MTNFEGWVLKINGVIFPNKLIALESYNCTPNQIMDLDPYRDGNGKLHRNALPHTASAIDFTTPNLYLRDMEILDTFLTSENRIKCQVDYWNDNTLRYESGEFYISDIPYGKVWVDERRKDILYKPIQISIVEF